MKPKARFIKSAVAAAKTCETQLPWARGVRRAAFIERRNSETEQRKRA